MPNTNAIENLSQLERRLTMAVPVADIERQVDERLKKLVRSVRMPGFRPGKVPLKIVAQQYGPQVRSEVTGDAVQKAFTDAVRDQNLRIAGYPRIERKEGAPEGELQFSATFEVYPEVGLGDLAGVSIERPTLGVAVALVPVAGRDSVSLRLAIGCVGPRPQRLAAIERQAEEQAPGRLAARADELAADAARAVEPVDDRHGSAEYKREMTRVFVRRALQAAVGRAEGREPDARYAYTVLV